MRQCDVLAADDTVLASLSGMSTTVTKMTEPHDGTQWLFIAFTYQVTSRGWRTDEAGRLVSRSASHMVCYFFNQDGGPIFSWGFPARDFTSRLRVEQTRGLRADPRP